MFMLFCMANVLVQTWQRFSDLSFRGCMHIPLADERFNYSAHVCLNVSATQVVTGFFCEHAFEMAQADKDQVIMDQIRQREEHICSFKVLFGHVDEDDCQSITFEQLEELLAREDMQAYLALLDITVESSSNMFKLLDTDGSGELSVEAGHAGNGASRNAWPWHLAVGQK